MACLHPPASSSDQPAPAGTAIAVPGAPAGCRASFVIPAALPHPDAREGFHQFQGELRGLDWGECVLMGPELKTGVWLWVLLPYASGWQGALSCAAGGLSSPVLLVGPPELQIPDKVKAKWYLGVEDPLGNMPVPTTTIPCPAGEPSGTQWFPWGQP